MRNVKNNDSAENQGKEDHLLWNRRIENDIRGKDGFKRRTSDDGHRGPCGLMVGGAFSN